MLRNYLTIAWRTITRHRGYTIINVLGFALGLCACIVIYLISDYELSFDTFHPDRQRIYRVMTTITENTGNRMQFGTVPLPGVLLLQSGLSGAGAFAAIQPWWGAPIDVSEKDKPSRKFDSRPEGTATHLLPSRSHPGFPSSTMTCHLHRVGHRKLPGPSGGFTKPSKELENRVKNFPLKVVSF